MRILLAILFLLGAAPVLADEPAPDDTPKPERGDASGREELVQASDAEPDLARLNGAALGTSDNPVRAYLPGGQQAYLDRLRCENGRHPHYVRIGSEAGGPYGNVMDIFEVKCRSKLAEKVYMDMYHPNAIEVRPLPGFTIDGF